MRTVTLGLARFAWYLGTCFSVGLILGFFIGTLTSPTQSGASAERPIALHGNAAPSLDCTPIVVTATPPFTRTPVPTRTRTVTRTRTATAIPLSRTATSSPTKSNTPSVTPIPPTATPTTGAGTTSANVYDDSYGPGWTDQSWETNVSVQTIYVHAGKNALSIQPTSGGATYNLDHPGFASAGYQYVDVWVYTPDTNYDIGIQLKDSAGNMHPFDHALTLSDFFPGGAKRANVWQLAHVPMGDYAPCPERPCSLEADGIVVSNLWFQNGLNGPSPTLYFDDIRFVGVGTPTLTPTVTGTPPTATSTLTSVPTLTAVATTVGGGLPWLNVAGGHLVRADNGQQVELRGANILHNEWVYPLMDFEVQAFPALHAWHGNLVVHGFASAPVVAGDAQYLAILDQYQTLAEQNHMYIVFCYYYEQINGEQPPYPTQNAQTALTILTQRYRAKSNVLFMLQAEPHSDSTTRVTWNDTSSVQLRPIYDRMIAAMRAVDDPAHKHIILASGDGYGRDIAAAVYDEYGHHGGTADPIQNSENFVYSSHPYDHPDQWSYWTRVADAGLPVLLTEFGTGGQMSQSDTVSLMGLFQNQPGYVGWTAWIFDNGGCPCLLGVGLTPSNPYGLSVQSVMGQQATVFP